ncbi:MAG TPA: hypothetical protein VFU69_04945 [Ktedonobacterales bacterium]|nr:hypothetical protein [Ktedonobacterales bacterium]
MGKLIETLQRVGKSSGGSMGFLGKNQAQSKAKAAGILVALGQADAGAVEAVAKAGADGVIFVVSADKSASKGFSAAAYQKAAEPLRAANRPWGIDLAAVVSSLPADALKGIREGGADFVSFPLDAPARLLQERPEGLDRIVTIRGPAGDDDDERYLRLVRSVNLLSVQVVELISHLSAERLHDLRIEELLHYRTVRELLRFPVIASLRGDLGNEEARLLVKLGISAIILQATEGESTAALAQRVAALREELERVPAPGSEDEDMPSLAFAPGSPARGEEPNRQH